MDIGSISKAPAPFEGQEGLKGGNRSVADVCDKLLDEVASFGSDEMLTDTTFCNVQSFSRFLLGMFPPAQYPEVDQVAHAMNMAFVNYFSNHDINTLKNKMTAELNTVIDILHHVVIPPCPGPYQESLSNEIRQMFSTCGQLSDVIQATPPNFHNIREEASILLGKIWLFDSLPEGEETDRDSDSSLAKIEQAVLDIVTNCYTEHPSIEDVKKILEGNPPENRSVISEMDEIRKMLNSGRYPWYIKT